jgi:photosystem II stability/assembly factor-like uncharacterized protein
MTKNMRKILVFLILFSSLLAGVASTVTTGFGGEVGWGYVELGSSGSPGSFQYLTFVDENRIVAATTGAPYYISGGNIYLSTDGGNSWSTTLQNVPANIQKIRFLNNQVGFAVGGGEGFGVAMYIGKTTDGGSTWVDLSENLMKSVGSSTYIPLYGLWIVDASTIYVSSGCGVYVTRDGGNTWSRAANICSTYPETSYIAENLQFPTASTGFVSGYRQYLFRTQDGGSSWEKLDAPWNWGEGKELWGLQFLDASNGWALVIDRFFPDIGAFLYRTTDGGENWSLVYQWIGWRGNNEYVGPVPETFYAKNSSELWAGGWEEIWHSSDGGTTWTLENEGGLYIRVWGFQMVGSESVPRAIASSGMSGTSIYGYYKYTGGTTSIFSYADYNGDRVTDVSAFHLSSDQFFTDYAGNLGQFGWGGSDSMPLIWDYDGDGKTDVSIYHIPTNQWFVKGVGNLGQFGWGGEESVPVPGDYNGDGRMERAFYHSPTNQWFVEGQDPVTFGWNGAECIPLPGDYDGDGKTDMVIYHIPTNQWFQYGVGDLGQFGWGGADCIPVPGDYNGDGKTEIAVYHIPTNQWFVKGIGNLGQYGWGGLESFPIPGDYNGDGKMERGFYRWNENWWFIEGESDSVWGWGGSEFMPITSSIAVYNWLRFKLHKFE